MSIFAKSAVLSLALATGVAGAAFAQSENLAALPPDAAAATHAVAPSTRYPGPKAGWTWTTPEQQTQPVAPSPAWIGPKPGELWSTAEKQTQPVAPSPAYPGPKPH